MQTLSAANLLEIWERGLGRTPVEQGLILLGAAFPAAAWDRLARLTIAQRDTALFQLRELTFGGQFTGLAECPGCQERLELAFSADDLRALDLIPAPIFALPETEPEPTSFRVEDYQIDFRLPTSADLLNVLRLEEAEPARQQLLEACLVSARRQERTLAVHELPAGVTQALIEAIGQAASLANLTIAIPCPACGGQSEIVFDIVSYFWSEIQAWAMRLLREVHALASAYGWSEAEILALSAWRRQRYLELVGA
jgi:hypothetical protein